MKRCVRAPLSRRRDIEAAVAAYDQANPRAPLGPVAARLLRVIFPVEDVCQRSLEDLAVDGFTRTSLPTLLQRLVFVGLLTRHRVAGAPHVCHLHLRRQP
jgi:hypothetical protein